MTTNGNSAIAFEDNANATYVEDGMALQELYLKLPLDAQLALMQVAEAMAAAQQVSRAA